jgi:hypothetical protein
MSLGHCTGLNGPEDILGFAPAGVVPQKRILLGNLRDLIMTAGIRNEFLEKLC